MWYLLQLVSATLCPWQILFLTCISIGMNARTVSMRSLVPVTGAAGLGSRLLTFILRPTMRSASKQSLSLARYTGLHLLLLLPLCILTRVAAVRQTAVTSIGMLLKRIRRSLGQTS